MYVILHHNGFLIFEQRLSVMCVNVLPYLYLLPITELLQTQLKLLFVNL
jgi:hypothetical protein